MFKIIGIVLIVLGGAALIYGQFSYTKEQEVFSIGSMEAKFRTKERVVIHPAIAGTVLAAGAGLLVFGVVKKK